MPKERKKSDNLPLYSGDSFQPTSNSLPSNIGEGHKVSAEYWDERSQTGAEALFGIAKQYLDFEDYAEKTRGDNELEKITNDFALDIANRLSYARGHEKSFHNADGSLKPNAVETLARQYQQRLNEVRVTINDIDKNNEWLARREQIAQSLQGEISKQLILNARKEGQAHFETALRLAKEKNDFDRQYEIVNDAFSAGHISEGEKDLYDYDISEKQTEKEKQDTLAFIEKQILTDPESFLYDAITGVYAGTLDPKEITRLRDNAQKRVNSSFSQFKEDSKSAKKPTKAENFITNRILAGVSQAELGLIEHVATYGTMRGKEQYISALLHRMSTQLPNFKSEEEINSARDRLTQFIADLRDMGVNVEKEDYLKKFDATVNKPKQKIPKIKAKERLENFIKTESTRLFSNNEFRTYLDQLALTNTDIATTIAGFRGKEDAGDFESAMKEILSTDKGKTISNAWHERNEIAVSEILVEFDSWHDTQIAQGETPSELAQKLKLSQIVNTKVGKDIALFSASSMTEAETAQKTANELKEKELERRKANRTLDHNTLASPEDVKKYLPQKPTVIEYSRLEINDADWAEDVGVYLPKSLESEYKKTNNAFAQFSLGGNQVVLPILGFSDSDSVVFPQTLLLFLHKFPHEMPELVSNLQLRSFANAKPFRNAFRFSNSMLKKIKASKELLPPLEEVAGADEILVSETATPASGSPDANLP